MSGRATWAVALRVLRQLRRDPRTVALLLIVPPVLLTIIKYAFEQSPEAFQRVGGPLVGIFPFVTMFLVTSITMLRERTSGTLERLMAMPLAKLDLLLGYGIAFAAVASLQAAIATAVAFGPLALRASGSVPLIGALAILNAILGMALGLFVSAFARTEFQAVQFMPAFILPQLLLCGLFVPRDRMAPLLEWISNALPLTYAYEALAEATSSGSLGSTGGRDAAVTIAFAIAALGLGAITLRRRTP